MRPDWLAVEAAATELKPAPMPPTAPSPLAKPLSEALKERETLPPAIPNPTGQPAPAEPMSLKELSQLLESAAKALLDSKLTLEKAHTATSKVGAMSSSSAKDKEIAGKSQGYAANIKKIGDSIEALAEDLKAYRDSLSTPTSSWLE